MKCDSSYRLLKMALIKSANDSLREIFIQCVYTHVPATNTERFQFLKQGPADKNKGPDPNKGSN